LQWAVTNVLVTYNVFTFEAAASLEVCQIYTMTPEALRVWLILEQNKKYYTSHMTNSWKNSIVKWA